MGRYRIIRKIGKSAHDVYLALDTVEKRHAAVKLVKAGEDTATRLMLEERRGALIQSQLRHLDPRVVEVYDYGDLEGYFYVAMQYVEGRSLAELLERDKRLDARRAATLALDICAQLEKFHSFQAEADGPRSAVVHGDIKPSNIHLGPHHTVRLLDFGIARALAPDREHTFHEFGSPGYCSPERLERSQVDAQSDLWAVGVTLYEMVAGTPPYQAENTQKLERLIQSGRPPRALPAHCPGGAYRQGAGARLKPREIEQEGDAYRYRAYQKLREGDRGAAVWYAVMARRLYEQASGFDRADLRAREM